MVNLTVENVLMDIATALPAGVMECDITEYDMVMDKEYNCVIDGKLTLIAPSGQKFEVSVREVN